MRYNPATDQASTIDEIAEQGRLAITRVEELRAYQAFTEAGIAFEVLANALRKLSEAVWLDDNTVRCLLPKAYADELIDRHGAAYNLLLEVLGATK